MKSDELTPGSSKWHFAIAEELKEEAHICKDKSQKQHLIELADFHELIGKNTKG